MSQTLNEMLNNVLMQSGFLKVAQFTGTIDPDNNQMVAIANRVAYEILNFYPWNGLLKETTINLTTGQALYPLPADFQSIISDSAWEADGSRKVDMPVSNAEWYMFKFSAFSDGGTIRARLMGKEIEVIDPNTGDSFQIEYVTKFPILNAIAAPIEWFTADTDTWLLDDQLLILGVQAHWQQAKLMPSYVEHMQNYMSKMNEAIGRENGAQTLGGRPHYPNRSPYTKLWVS